jgi:heat shock protein HslJ
MTGSLRSGNGTKVSGSRPRTLLVHVALLAAITVTACKPNNPGSLPGDLAGSSWRLVEFESSDDAIGVVRPAASAVYSMTLEADGTASFQLDCNRGSGSWRSVSAGPDDGTLELSPLATTRAACPPGSLDQQIARHAEYFRTYLIRDGRLYVSLMADGGIYVWEPIER